MRRPARRSDGDSGEVELRPHQQQPAPPLHRTVRITVQDTGTGVPPEKLHLLFLPFSQVASATGAKAIGTGLGLTIVKRLLEAMHGTIIFESEPGAAMLLHEREAEGQRETNSLCVHA